MVGQGVLVVWFVSTRDWVRASFSTSEIAHCSFCLFAWLTWNCGPLTFSQVLEFNICVTYHAGPSSCGFQLSRFGCNQISYFSLSPDLLWRALVFLVPLAPRLRNPGFLKMIIRGRESVKCRFCLLWLSGQNAEAYPVRYDSWLSIAASLKGRHCRAVLCPILSLVTAGFSWLVDSSKHKPACFLGVKQNVSWHELF